MTALVVPVVCTGIAGSKLRVVVVMDGAAVHIAGTRGWALSMALGEAVGEAALRAVKRRKILGKTWKILGKY